MAATERQRAEPAPETGDQHLRSTREVIGYHVQARDGEIGHIADLLMDDERWALRYLIVDTRNWWPGKEVVVAPPWITAVSWKDRAVMVDLTRDAIKASPEYDPARLTRDYEQQLHRHHERAGYWEDPLT
jgi:hypothetical protein